MKAAQISQYGGPDVIKVTTDTKKPIVEPGHVLVEVRAASLNPFDTMVREGHVAPMVPPFPVTLGGDIAGLVVEVAEGVTDIKVGDEVYGQANVVAGNSGALAEFAATKASQVAKKPHNTDFQQAAALPLVGASALQAITEHIDLKSGQKILVHGGTGGIGSMAVQLAKHLGAYVATTVPSAGIEHAKSLGADEVIDFKTQKFEEIVKDFDAVFDTVGGEALDKSLQVLKKGGKIVSMVGTANESKAQQLGVSVIAQQTVTNTERLDRLAKLVEAGVLSAHIGQVFSLEAIKEAFAQREAGGSGKIVIEIS